MLYTTWRDPNKGCNNSKNILFSIAKKKTIGNIYYTVNVNNVPYLKSIYIWLCDLTIVLAHPEPYVVKGGQKFPLIRLFDQKWMPQIASF